MKSHTKVYESYEESLQAANNDLDFLSHASL